MSVPFGEIVPLHSSQMKTPSGLSFVNIRDSPYAVDSLMVERVVVAIVCMTEMELILALPEGIVVIPFGKVSEASITGADVVTPQLLV